MTKDDKDAVLVTCSRKNTEHPNGVCGVEIDLVKENLIVLQPKVPLLAAKCPTCGYSNVLKKPLSIRLVDDFFDGAIITTPDDDDAAIDPMTPQGEIIAARVISGLKMFGYKGNKWAQALGAITEFVTDMSEFQTPNGLAQLLATMKINSQYIPLVVKRTFGKEDMPFDMGKLSDLIMGTNGQSLNAPPYGMQQPQQQGFPQYVMGQNGGGQQPVIVMPNQPAPNVVKESSDGVSVEETVKNGEIVKRVTRHNGAVVDTPKSEMDSMVSMLAFMKEMGLIGNNAPPSPPPAVSNEVLETLAALTKAVSSMGNGQKSADDDVAYRREQDQRNEVRTMAEKVDQMRQDAHNTQMESMREQIKQFADIANNAPRDGLNDIQYKVSAQSDNLKTVTGAIESMGEQIVGPLVKMQTMTAEMQAMLLMRKMEGADGVQAGTYSSPDVNQEVPAEQVRSDLNTWKDRVKAIKGENG